MSDITHACIITTNASQLIRIIALAVIKVILGIVVVVFFLYIVIRYFCLGTTVGALFRRLVFLLQSQWRN